VLVLPLGSEVLLLPLGLEVSGVEEVCTLLSLGLSREEGAREEASENVRDSMRTDRLASCVGSGGGAISDDARDDAPSPRDGALGDEVRDIARECIGDGSRDSAAAGVTGWPARCGVGASHTLLAGAVA